MKYLIVGIVAIAIALFIYSIDCKAPYYKNTIIGSLWCKTAVKQVGIDYKWVDGR